MIGKFRNWQNLLKLFIIRVNLILARYINMFHRRFCSKLIGITLGAYAVNVFQSTCDDKVVPVVKKNRFDGMALMAGSTGKQLSSDIANLLGCPTINVTTQRYTL